MAPRKMTRQANWEVIDLSVQHTIYKAWEVAFLAVPRIPWAVFSVYQVCLYYKLATYDSLIELLVYCTELYLVGGLNLM